jgi:hypothetical protein
MVTNSNKRESIENIKKFGINNRSDHFQFDSVFIKKIIKVNFFKKTENRTETRSTRPVRFGFLGQKLVQTSLARS